MPRDYNDPDAPKMTGVVYHLSTGALHMLFVRLFRAKMRDAFLDDLHMDNRGIYLGTTGRRTGYTQTDDIRERARKLLEDGEISREQFTKVSKILTDITKAYDAHCE